MILRIKKPTIIILTDDNCKLDLYKKLSEPKANAMKTDLPKANSPDTWKYPKLLAEIIYNGMTVDEIVERCVKFTEPDWEFEATIPLIKCIVPQILAEEIAGPPDFEHIKGMNLGDLSYMASMMPIGIQDGSKQISSDALFFWLIQLSYYCQFDICRPHSDLKFMSLKTDQIAKLLSGVKPWILVCIARYSLNPEHMKVLPLLRQAMSDFFLAYGWMDFFVLADTYNSVCVASGQKSRIVYLCKSKLCNHRHKNNIELPFVKLLSCLINFIEVWVKEGIASDCGYEELAHEVGYWLDSFTRQAEECRQSEVTDRIQRVKEWQNKIIE